MQEFLNQLESISPALPWLFRGVLIALMAMVFWLVASLLIHWFAEFLSAQLARAIEVLKSWRQWLYEIALRRLGEVGQPVDRFVENHNQIFSLDDDNRYVRRVVSTIKKTLRKLTGKVTDLDHTLSKMENRIVKQGLDLRRNVETLQNMEIAGEQILPSKRQAFLKTVTFGLLGIVFIAVNTLMLSEFFKSLMPSMLVLGLPLYLVAACLFSLLEFGAGAAIAFIDGSKPVDTLKRLGLMLVIAVLGFIEFGFYAGFGENLGFNPLEGLVEPGTRAAILAQKWFGVFGPTIVFVMAWCADMLFNGIRNLFADNISRGLDRIRYTALRTGEALDALKAMFGDVQSKDYCATAIAASQKLLQDTLEQAQTIRLAETRKLDRAQMIRLYYGHLFLFLLSVAATLVIVAIYSQNYLATVFADPGSVPGALPLIDRLTLPVVAVLESFLVLGAGYLTTWVLRPVQAASGSGASSTWPNWTTLALAILLLLCFVAGNASLLFKFWTAPEFMGFGFVLMAGLLLFYCGRHVGFMLPALWALALSLWVLGLGCGLMAAAAACALVIIFVILVKFLVELLDFPFRWILSFFEKKKAAVAA